MKIYTYSQARQRLASLLEEAQKKGSVGIRRRDGSTFILKPSSATESPLDVEGVDTGITAREIIRFIQEERKSYDDSDE